MTSHGEQALLVTDVFGQTPNTSWQRQSLLVTHNELVLILQSDVTAEHSTQTQAVLRQIATTMRFLPDGPRRLSDIFDYPNSPQLLAAVAATATSAALITPTPECDLVCRDATAWATISAGITPESTLTYPPDMATQEARFNEMLAATAAATLTTTPTPPPFVTPVPTPKPAPESEQSAFKTKVSGCDPPARLRTRVSPWRMRPLNGR